MWRVFAVLALLLGAPNAEAQELFRSVGTVQGNFLLDGFATQPTACYSWRRLRSAYATNKAVNVVRASDSTTSDIGFVLGSPDTATLATFCNATTCKVVTWYDQCGSARDQTQGTDASRPPASLASLGTWPSFQTTSGSISLAAAGSITPASGLISYSAIGKRTAGTGVCGMIQPTSSAANNSIGPNTANNWRLAAGAASFNASAADSTWISAQSVANGASSVLSINGVETTGTITANTTAGAPRIIGAASTTCFHAEVAFWDNYGLTTAERSYLTTNQRTFGGF